MGPDLEQELHDAHLRIAELERENQSLLAMQMIRSAEHDAMVRTLGECTTSVKMLHSAVAEMLSRMSEDQILSSIKVGGQLQ